MHEKERGAQNPLPIQKHSILAEILIRLLDRLASDRQNVIRTWQITDIFPASERTLGKAIRYRIRTKDQGTERETNAWTVQCRVETTFAGSTTT